MQKNLKKYGYVSNISEVEPLPACVPVQPGIELS